MGRLNKLEVLELHSSSSHFTKLNYRGLSKRKTTETWLKGLAKERGFKFRYFLTLSFYKLQRCIINQYLDNEHIKKVILTSSIRIRNQNRIRFWLFVEKHKDGDLHLHVLMEGMDDMEWLSKRNRKISIRKSTILDLIQGRQSIGEMMLESLAHHMKRWVFRLGHGKQSFNAKDIGEVDWRIEYSTSRLIVGTSMVGSTLIGRIALWSNAYKKHTNHINRDRDNPLKTHHTISTRE